MASRLSLIAAAMVLYLSATTASAQQAATQQTPTAAPATAPATSPALTRAQKVQHYTALQQQLGKALAAKDYGAAAELCKKQIAIGVSDKGNARYNLACCLARLGKNQEALAALDKAVDEGFIDAAHMKVDDDLVSLRDDPASKDAFKALAAKAAENERAAFAASYRPGKEIAGVKTIEDYPEGGLRYRLRMSPDATAAKPNKLIVWLHPSGGSLNDNVEAMAPMLLKHGYALVVFTQKNFAGWGEGDDLKLSVSLKAVGKIPGIDANKPILLGFSAGGQLALLFWAQNPSRFGGLVLDAAYPVRATPTGYALAPLPKSKAIKDVPVLALVGTADGGSQFWKKAEQIWRDAGIPLQVIYVPGKKHQWLFDKERTQQLDEWLSQVASGKKPGSQPATAPAQQP